jgi:four helix bundle suffix protein
LANTPKVANTLIHQEDVVLRKLLERLQNDFVKNGGIKEKMFAARSAYRKNNGKVSNKKTA